MKGSGAAKGKDMTETGRGNCAAADDRAGTMPETDRARETKGAPETNGAPEAVHVPDFAGRIRAICGTFGFSRAELSAFLRGNPQRLRQLEQGVKEPTEEEIHLILSTLPVREDWLLHDDGPMLEEDYDGLTPGERIREIRTDLGLGTAQFAGLVGLTVSVLSHLEKGETKVTRDIAVNIGEHTGVGADWIRYGKASRKNDPVDFWMKEWLWQHPEEREEILRRMEEEHE